MGPDHLFTLRAKCSAGDVTIHAFDAQRTDHQTGHQRIDVVIKQGRKVVFPRGATWCAVNRWTAIDGKEARALVLSLAAMKPGDTDADYFADYTPAQLAFAEAFGEELSMVREERYGEGT